MDSPVCVAQLHILSNELDRTVNCDGSRAAGVKGFAWLQPHVPGPGFSCDNLGEDKSSWGCSCENTKLPLGK